MVKVAPKHSFVAESLSEETPAFAHMRPQTRTALLFFLSFAAVASAKLVILTISEQLIKIHERVVLLVLKTVATAASALISRNTDTTGSEQGQGEKRRPCVRACARVFELTYSDNVGHPARVLDPNETRHQRGPVFPNRSPGRQPSISHGRKVAGSTFLFKIPKTTQIRASKLNSTDHLWVLMSLSDVRSLYLVKHFFLVFSVFFFSVASLRAA